MKNKQFKLIKTYPNSYALGFTVKSDGLGQYVSYNPLIILQASEVENYPEFWQEIKEYDFEIVKFRDKATGTIFSRYIDISTFIFGYENCEIYSVKRKSDGEVFCIGDKIQNFEREGRVSNIISTISINKNSVWLQVGDVGGCVLGYAKKHKTPLFTTLDGKDIYEEDSYYTVFFKETKDKSDPERWKVLGKFSAKKLTGDDKWTNECKYFSSIASAINWLEENKPQFSKKQVINILKGLDRELNEYEDTDINYYSYIERYKDEK